MPDDPIRTPVLIAGGGPVGLVLAIVLGPLAEASLRQSLIMSHGSFMTFFERPISGTIMVIAIALFAWPLFSAIRRRLRSGAFGAEG